MIVSSVQVCNLGKKNLLVVGDEMCWWVMVSGEVDKSRRRWCRKEPLSR